MDQVLFCSISYLIEIIKLFAATILVLNLEMKSKKCIAIVSAIVFFFLVVVSAFFNVNDYGIIYTVLAIVHVSLCLKKIAHIKMTVAASLLINFADTFVGLAAIALFKLRYEEVSGFCYAFLPVNFVSLLLIMVIYVLKKKKIIRSVVKPDINFKDLLILALGILSIAIYLSSIMVFISKSEFNSYQNKAAFALSFGGLAFLLICFSLMRSRSRTSYLQKENELSQELIASQEKYYSMLLEREEETKKFRHDIRNHMYCLRTLYTNKYYEEYDKYWDRLQIELDDLSSSINTGNKLTDVILNDIRNKHKDVVFDCIGTLDSKLKIESMDICTIFSNLFSNAFEAADLSSKKRVDFSVKYMGTAVLVLISNSCDKEPVIENGTIVTTKNEKNHGYGINNVKECLKRYNGSLNFSFDEGVFSAELIIPNVIDL